MTAPEDFERLHVRPNPGRTLIVGSYVTKGKPDRRERYADVLGVDMRDGPGVDVVQNMEGPATWELGYFDHVECMSVLEHSRKPWLAAANIEGLMRVGATLHFSVPFIWRVHDHPGDYWRMTPDGVRELFPRIEWSALLLGGERLYKPGAKTRSTKVEGFPFHERVETFGFGVRV